MPPEQHKPNDILNYVLKNHYDQQELLPNYIICAFRLSLYSIWIRSHWI